MSVSIHSGDAQDQIPLELAGRAVDKAIAIFDHEKFRAASPVTPKFLSLSELAMRWTGAHGAQAFFFYRTNYLI